MPTRSGRLVEEWQAPRGGWRRSTSLLRDAGGGVPASSGRLAEEYSRLGEAGGGMAGSHAGWRRSASPPVWLVEECQVARVGRGRSSVDDRRDSTRARRGQEALLICSRRRAAGNPTLERPRRCVAALGAVTIYTQLHYVQLSRVHIVNASNTDLQFASSLLALSITSVLLSAPHTSCAKAQVFAACHSFTQVVRALHLSS